MTPALNQLSAMPSRLVVANNFLPLPAQAGRGVLFHFQQKLGMKKSFCSVALYRGRLKNLLNGKDAVMFKRIKMFVGSLLCKVGEHLWTSSSSYEYNEQENETCWYYCKRCGCTTWF